ncbi:crotonobetaine/carnitine-CoA ligase [Variovorax sp. HW608]|uniref:AMP-binding protein n=1 Tax=Variovorax sp. HW608 TaxID=1034889 RepID=UPI00081F9CE9|nr:AMP-binding protein [Variovorax sp. HW608]SCK09910.1 crotonobetaine/carnitine-CoA ligase [Variovorax sp. HW608]
MIPIDDHSTIGECFLRAAQAYCENTFLAVPANPGRAYYPQGLEVSFGEARDAVHQLAEVYARAGYGVGHRIALLMENRPEHLLHKLAMNMLGVCCVPLNGDHRPREMAYVLDHARVDVVVVLEPLEPLLAAALSEARNRPAVVRLAHFAVDLPRPQNPAEPNRPMAETPASVLYTSGTTGRPKGCVLSHRYELASGAWYATRGGLCAFAEGAERLYNPLPLFHVNASVLSFFSVMLTGNCQVQTDRFHTARFWPEVCASRATAVHYLGVIVPMLLSQPASALDRAHTVRFAIGAGVEPQLHEVFERRFGFPLIEIWGMTEMVRALADNLPSRQVGQRAFGTAQLGVEVRVVDDADHDVPDEAPGEMVIRHSEATPRKDFFSGYLDDEAATEQAWRGGWFHTGDIVRRASNGMLHFVDRRKNIIRRSGENIAAAEVEALLQTHPDVAHVAVLAVPDEIREEEVLACVVLRPSVVFERETMARALFDFCFIGLAYYKAPGWVWITDHIPTTATQKIQKHQLFPAGTDPRTVAGMVDLRVLKKRGQAVQ